MNEKAPSRGLRSWFGFKTPPRALPDLAIPENYQPRLPTRTTPYKMIAWLIGGIAAIVAITSQGEMMPMSIAVGLLPLAAMFAAVASIIAAIEDLRP